VLGLGLCTSICTTTLGCHCTVPVKTESDWLVGNLTTPSVQFGYVMPKKVYNCA